jgi:hypothetical protein
LQSFPKLSKKWCEFVSLNIESIINHVFSWMSRNGETDSGTIPAVTER